jgi:hypothetical protein
MLRVVRKLQSQLPVAGEPDSSAGALGDWFVMRFVIARHPLLMLVSSTSLLACIEPAREVRNLPQRLPRIVGDRLHRLGLSRDVIDAETAAMQPVVIGPTNDRSVTGAMVDYCFLARPYDSDRGWSEAQIPSTEMFLWETPMLTSNRKRSTIFPGEHARSILIERWGMGQHEVSDS